MKRVFVLFLSLLMSISLVGCSANEPTTVVKEFFTAVKDFNLEAMNNCLAEKSTYDFQNLGESDENSVGLEKYFVDYAKQVTYEIQNTSVEENKGVVTVKVNYVDASPIFTAVMGEYFTQALALAFTGADTEQLTELAASIYTEKSNSLTPKPAECTIDIECQKIDDAWKISSFPDEILDILSGNLYSLIGNMSDAFEDSESEPEPTPSEPDYSSYKKYNLDCGLSMYLEDNFSKIRQEGVTADEYLLNPCSSVLVFKFLYDDLGVRKDNMHYTEIHNWITEWLDISSEFERDTYGNWHCVFNWDNDKSTYDVRYKAGTDALYVVVFNCFNTYDKSEYLPLFELWGNSIEVE